MPGLLNQATQTPSSPMVDMQQAQAGTSAKMDKLKRLVLAGKKALYTKPASDKLLAYLDKDNLPESVGLVISMLMVLLIDKGREQGAPPDLIVPAGVMLVGDLLAYAGEVYGIEVDEVLTKEAVMSFVKTLGEGFAQGAAQSQPQQPQQPPMAGGMQ